MGGFPNQLDFDSRWRTGGSPSRQRLVFGEIMTQARCGQRRSEQRMVRKRDDCWPLRRFTTARAAPRRRRLAASDCRSFATGWKMVVPINDLLLQQLNCRSFGSISNGEIGRDSRRCWPPFQDGPGKGGVRAALLCLRSVRNGPSRPTPRRPRPAKPIGIIAQVEGSALVFEMSVRMMTVSERPPSPRTAAYRGTG
jgi:hypothetical protein